MAQIVKCPFCHQDVTADFTSKNAMRPHSHGPWDKRRRCPGSGKVPK